MKKVFLVITLLTAFFLSPVKAETYEDFPYFEAISYMDLTQLGMSNETPVLITWYFTHDQAPVKRIYVNIPRLMNMSTTMAYGTATVNAGNGSNLTATFEWNAFEDYATINYMGLEFTADNFTPGTGQETFTVGNGFEWWSDNSEETPSSDIDLSTIQTYLLIISFLLFINFLRG